jgi:hypothetical protein
MLHDLVSRGKAAVSGQTTRVAARPGVDDAAEGVFPGRKLSCRQHICWQRLCWQHACCQELDEFGYLSEADPSIPCILQAIWDRDTQGRS